MKSCYRDNMFDVIMITYASSFVNKFFEFFLKTYSNSDFCLKIRRVNFYQFTKSFFKGNAALLNL